MKKLKYFLFLLLIAIIGTSIYIAVQPNDYEFSRSRTIQAPASLLFNKVNDFKNWLQFSPWLEQEPNANLTYGETTSGKGASYSWEGAILGEGSMETLATEGNTFISQRIYFIKPFSSESDIYWNFEPSENGTKVIWGMEGEQDFMTKMYTAFAGSIEKNTAPDFERGLFKLDSVAKADMQKYSITVNGVTQHGGGYYLYNTASCKLDDVESKIQEMLPKVTDFATANNITMAGAPFVNYIKWDEANNAAIISCCIPTTEKVITTDSGILTGQLLPFKAVKTTLKGNYTNLDEAWDTARNYIPQNGLEFAENGPVLEVYPTDPKNYPNPADWVTEIYIAVN
ncbi:SRPBCC family protein [Flavobacteriaceae bacterium XHP0103]|uniref:SRPBCC family protein n=1 Tax=Marixanthotalea marina TaxID=2844359 RepID=UPI002989ACF9|nr:GyrI-like domain-containing protein [Marixanthotalea marina]MBU3822446.1 SRPBCC family protein [Marixanthotalea marina]